MPKGKKGFQPGASGNPNGRPRKAQCIPDILRKIGKEKIIHPKTGKKISKMEALMHMVFKNATEGDSWAVNFIAERTEGKPIQNINTNQNINMETPHIELVTMTEEEIKAMKNENKVSTETD